MKKFIIQSLFAIIITLFVLSLAGTINMYFALKYPGSKINPFSLKYSDVLLAKQKSKKNKRVKKLILGDSVGHQLYNPKDYNDSIYSLTSNQAISLAGQYCLLRLFIDNNKDSLPNEVFLLCTPYSLTNNLDRLAYNYFLKPFYYDSECHKWLNDSILTKRVKEIPFFWTANLPIIKYSNYTPDYTLYNDTTNWCSQISLTYLEKIENLCKEYNICFKMVSPDISDFQQSKISKLFKENNLTIKNYCSKINFSPDSIFYDHSHYKNQYIPKDYLKLL